MGGIRFVPGLHRHGADLVFQRHPAEYVYPVAEGFRFISVLLVPVHCQRNGRRVRIAADIDLLCADGGQLRGAELHEGRGGELGFIEPKRVLDILSVVGHKAASARFPLGVRQPSGEIADQALVLAEGVPQLFVPFAQAAFGQGRFALFRRFPFRRFGEQREADGGACGLPFLEPSADRHQVLRVAAAHRQGHHVRKVFRKGSRVGDLPLQDGKDLRCAEFADGQELGEIFLVRPLVAADEGKGRMAAVLDEKIAQILKITVLPGVGQVEAKHGPGAVAFIQQVRLGGKGIGSQRVRVKHLQQQLVRLQVAAVRKRNAVQRQLQPVDPEEAVLPDLEGPDAEGDLQIVQHRRVAHQRRLEGVQVRVLLAAPQFRGGQRDDGIGPGGLFRAGGDGLPRAVLHRVADHVVVVGVGDPRLDMELRPLLRRLCGEVHPGAAAVIQIEMGPAHGDDAHLAENEVAVGTGRGLHLRADGKLLPGGNGVRQLHPEAGAGAPVFAQQLIAAVDLRLAAHLPEFQIERLALQPVGDGEFVGKGDFGKIRRLVDKGQVDDAVVVLPVKFRVGSGHQPAAAEIVPFSHGHSLPFSLRRVRRCADRTRPSQYFRYY